MLQFGESKKRAVMEVRLQQSKSHDLNGYFSQSTQRRLPLSLWNAFSLCDNHNIVQAKTGIPIKGIIFFLL